MAERIIGAMRTADGYWRVEVVKEGRGQWFRVWHGATVVHDRAGISTVQRILGDTFDTLQPVEIESGAA
ncbi:hypothetical protein AMIS_20580 [Actinoplanes missouriensis 431]|uniref:Uncharacterized protein n=1 Tax=Actinoplanes missouriensis (strain ATCC 14538 / DSM 43046 / CBS 188.64 / JCM 3121 / NBRC 102363 / NCIMB 12654 / NRRL B-3342 / UNCC 431) TaxID=512565 RepID=I0H2P1_ACTM4|nr:hypothetical protein [Actinoplanes missouriensis]BAL87278.1 hypothetical protein AMIS_20580 [Actinoplanes missouriensis 431]